MNNKILFTIILFLIVSGTIARRCYRCTACPRPFSGNEAGVDKIDIGDDEYCQKTIILGAENRDRGGNDCTPVDKVKFCCKGDLCNGAITTTLSIKLLTAITSLFFLIQFFY